MMFSITRVRAETKKTFKRNGQKPLEILQGTMNWGLKSPSLLLTLTD